MTCSVLLTFHNRPQHLLHSLQALAIQTVCPDEVVVADDGSDAWAVAQVQPLPVSLPFAVKWVRQEHDGYRLAAARNLAIRVATGDYLVFLDCDILAMPDLIAVHLAQAAPHRFLAGNRALLSEAGTAELFGGGRMSAERLEALWAVADRQHLPRLHRTFQRDLFLRRFRLVDGHRPKLLGCHFSLPRADLESINGFDEAYVGWGYEDDDLALRLYMNGVRSRSVILSARAMHLHHPSLRPDDRVGPRPNRDYFIRRNVVIRCERGLHR